MQRRSGSVSRNGAHCADQRLRLEHHAGTAAERHVVHLAVPALAVRAEVVHVQLDVTRGDRPSDNTDAERSRKHLGKDRDARGSGSHRSPRCHGVTVTVPAAMSMPVT